MCRRRTRTSKAERLDLALAHDFRQRTAFFGAKEGTTARNAGIAAEALVARPPLPMDRMFIRRNHSGGPKEVPGSHECAPRFVNASGSVIPTPISKKKLDGLVMFLYVQYRIRI